MQQRLVVDHQRLLADHREHTPNQVMLAPWVYAAVGTYLWSPHGTSHQKNI
jgi:hypothetical protein